MALADQAAGTALPFATTRASDGEVVGSTRFMNVERWEWDKAGLHPDARRDRVDVAHCQQPNAPRSTPKRSSSCSSHAFDVWNVLRVTLKTDARNDRSRDAILASRRAIRRRAAGPHARVRRRRPRDSAFYSILASEWPAVRTAYRGARWASPMRDAGAHRFRTYVRAGDRPGLSRCGYACRRRATATIRSAPRSAS